jgi:hypothetical protein
MNIKPILNKSSPRAHTESKFDKLGDPGKPVKYLVHSSKRKEKKRFFIQAAITAIDEFLVKEFRG